MISSNVKSVNDSPPCWCTTPFHNKLSQLPLLPLCWVHFKHAGTLRHLFNPSSVKVHQKLNKTWCNLTQCQSFRSKEKSLQGSLLAIYHLDIYLATHVFTAEKHSFSLSIFLSTDIISLFKYPNALQDFTNLYLISLSLTTNFGFSIGRKLRGIQKK